MEKEDKTGQVKEEEIVTPQPTKVKSKSIIEVSDLPEGTKLYVKKDFLGYRIVNPIRNEDGTLNWVNVITGGWRNLITITIVITLLLWTQYDSHNKVKEYQEYCDTISKNPVQFCENIGFYTALNKSKAKLSGNSFQYDRNLSFADDS